MPHRPYPLDAYDDVFRCTCGEVFASSTGYAICPQECTDDEPTYGEFVKTGRMAELDNQPKGNTVMATDLNTAEMTLDELDAAVTAGDLAIEDVHFTDAQAAEAETKATLTVAELHAALDTLFRDDDTPEGMVEVVFASILGIVAECRQTVALFDLLGIDEETAASLFVGPGL